MNPNQKVLNEIFHSLLQVRNELPSLSNDTVIYFPDFNYIHPYIYRQTEGRYHYTDMFGSTMFSLNEFVTIPKNVHLCISLPTIMELLYSLQRHYNFLNKHLNDSESSSYVYKCVIDLSEGKTSIREINSEMVRRFLIVDRRLTGLDKRVANVLNLLASGKLELLTAHYEPSEINDLLISKGKLLDRITEEMQGARSLTDQRDAIDKVISYKADAHNTFLPILNELNDKRVVNFVCSSRFL